MSILAAGLGRLHADGETTQFAGQVSEPSRHAQTHAPLWLKISMSRQRHLADSHPQLPPGEEGLDLLNLAGRKLHHFCTVSAPLVRFRVVQFLETSGGATECLSAKAARPRMEFSELLLGLWIFHKRCIDRTCRTPGGRFSSADTGIRTRSCSTRLHPARRRQFGPVTFSCTGMQGDAWTRNHTQRRKLKSLLTPANALRPEKHRREWTKGEGGFSRVYR